MILDPEKKFKFEITTDFATLYYADSIDIREGVTVFEPRAIRSPSENWDPTNLEVMLPYRRIVKILHYKLNPIAEKKDATPAQTG